MKVTNFFHLPNKTVITVDGDLYKEKCKKVIINNKEYDFGVVYDMKNSFYVDAKIDVGEEVQVL